MLGRHWDKALAVKTKARRGLGREGGRAGARERGGGHGKGLGRGERERERERERRGWSDEHPEFRRGGLDAPRRE
jgi:hypothetical protein